jgi:hypothetical protein
MYEALTALMDTVAEGSLISLTSILRSKYEADIISLADTLAPNLLLFALSFAMDTKIVRTSYVSLVSLRHRYHPFLR